MLIRKIDVDSVVLPHCPLVFVPKKYKITIDV